MKTDHLVYLALGTNLGNRSANLQEAHRQINRLISIVRSSHIFETPPWGVRDQPAFLNQVLEATTNLSPVELLHKVKQIESDMGRVPSVRFGPRLIDIDILIYDDLQFDSAELTLPHPRLYERAFVLVPLGEISPDLVLPGTEDSISQLLKHLDQNGIVRWKENDD